jgi:hypothetical protein
MGKLGIGLSIDIYDFAHMTYFTFLVFGLGGIANTPPIVVVP